MALAPIDVFHFIVAPLLTAYFCRLDTLGVNDGGAGRGLAPKLSAQTTTQAVVNRFPNALQPPEAEVMINAFPFGGVLRQHLPRNAAANQIENRVQDFTHIQLARPSTGFRFGDESFNMIIFIISQVA